MQNEIIILPTDLQSAARASAVNRMPVTLARRDSDNLTITISATKITRRNGVLHPYTVSLGYCRMGFRPFEVRSVRGDQLFFWDLKSSVYDAFRAADEVTALLAKEFADSQILADREHDREQARQERASDDLLKDSGIL
jgi:hypothetical protein